MGGATGSGGAGLHLTTLAHTKKMFVHTKKMFAHTKKMFAHMKQMFVHTKKMFVRKKKMSVRLKSMSVHSKKMLVLMRKTVHTKMLVSTACRMTSLFLCHTPPPLCPVYLTPLPLSPDQPLSSPDRSLLPQGHS